MSNLQDPCAMSEEQIPPPSATQEGIFPVDTMGGEEEDADLIPPRTPNDPYTDLNDAMIRNIQKDKTPHFQTSAPDEGESAYGPGREGGRYYVDRHTRVSMTWWGNLLICDHCKEKGEGFGFL